MKHLYSVALASILALTSTACLSRSLIRTEVNPDKPVILMETHDETWSPFNWPPFSIRNEHVFWTCTQGTTSIECERRCGDDMEFVCPSYQAVGGFIVTSGNQVQ